MPRPEDVNPNNFRVVHVLYDDGEFSVAWGEWEDGTERLGMRWNGNGRTKRDADALSRPCISGVKPLTDLRPFQRF